MPAGTYLLRVIVTDSDGVTDTVFIPLTVATFASRSRPRPRPDPSSGTMVVTLDVSDLVTPAADGYTYTLSSQPTWLTINAATGLLTATLTPASETDTSHHGDRDLRGQLDLERRHHLPLEHQLSTVLRSLRERHRLVQPAAASAGTSLVEVVVAMTIMVICGAIFTGAVVTLYSVTNRAQAVTNSSTQTNQAYQALDKLVRYAAAISTPGFGAGVGSAKYWYVELRDTTSGSEQCTQLRLQTRHPAAAATQLERVQPGHADPVGPDRFRAHQRVRPRTGRPTSPSLLAASSPTANHQQLTITLVASSGPLSSPATSKSSIGLTALNSTVPPATGSICQQAGRP